MQGRFGTGVYVLLHQPRPGDRETRYRPATDRSMQRPRGGMKDV